MLHNIAKILKEPDPLVNEEEEIAVNFVNNMLREELREMNILNINDIVRRQLIHDYFNTLL